MPAVVVALEKEALGGGQPGERGAHSIAVWVVGRCEEEQQARSPVAIESLARRCHLLECQGLRLLTCGSVRSGSARSKSPARRNRSGLSLHRSAIATPAGRSGTTSTAERRACILSSQPTMPSDGDSASARVAMLTS